MLLRGGCLSHPVQDQAHSQCPIPMRLRIGLDSLKQPINKGVTVKHLKF